jgi:hypothetical protein
LPGRQKLRVACQGRHDSLGGTVVLARSILGE